MSITGSGRAQPLLDDQIEPFLQHLRDAGYAERTIRKKWTIARAFARWAKRKGIATSNLNDGHADAFVRRLPRGGKPRLKFELAGVRLFLGYLRGTAVRQCQAPLGLRVRRAYPDRSRMGHCQIRVPPMIAVTQ